MSTDDCDVEMDLPIENIRTTIKDQIYYAAKDGHPISLIAALNDIDDPDVRDYLVNQIHEEPDGIRITPLAVASTLGRYNVVKALLTNYKIDIEKECSIKFEGHLVHGSSALWCACLAGNLNIVKLLIKHGANVNHKTKTHSTPLRAACFEGRLDIVRYLVMHGADIQVANAYNNTCLMFSAYKGHTAIVEYLLNSGADPNTQATLCGGTALHYAAKNGHVDACDILLDHKANLMKNQFGMTPVLVAAERTNEQVVELFSAKNLLTKEEKIDALELMGASFANDKDNYSVQKAYQYMLLGMQLRYEDSDNVIRKKLMKPVPAYDNWVECQTVQDLQAIRLNNNSIHMESLTIRERILGKENPELPQPIVYRGAVYADQNRFDRCETLWLYAMELRQNTGTSVERDLLRFAQLYSQMLHIRENLKLKNILSVLHACITELETNSRKISNPGSDDDIATISEEYEQNIVTALYLLTIITKLLKTPNRKFAKNEIQTLYKLVFQLNKMNAKLRDGQTLVHLAVNGVTPVDDFHTNDVCRFPCIDTVKLLLKCGADVSAIDCDRNTPLHTLTSTFQTARQSDIEIFQVVDEIIKLFVEAGSHLDTVNNDGLTAAQVSSLFAVEAIVKKYETQFISLKCLSSQCIVRHRVNYKIVRLPQDLERFIEIHSAKKL